MKILVLERVNDMEIVLANYIEQQFPESEIRFIPNVDTVPLQEIIGHVKWCDIIAVQSIFDQVETFEKIVSLFWKMPELRKPTHLIHSTLRLLEALNTRISIEAQSSVAMMLKGGMGIYNIYYKVWEDPADAGQVFQSKQFFIKKLYTFDAVKLWWNAKNKIVWDERPFFIPYTLKNYFRPDKPGVMDCLERAEIPIFVEALMEMQAFTTEKLEDLTDGRYKMEDTEDLIKEKTAWLSVINKILTSPAINSL